MGFSFINAMILINALSIENYATYSYVVTIVLWVAVFMDLGVSNMIFSKGLMNRLEEVDIYITARTFNSILVIFLLATFFAIQKPKLLLIGSIYGIIIFLNSTSVLFKSIARSQEYSKADLFIVLSEIILRTLFLGLFFLILPKESFSLPILMTIFLFAGSIAFVMNYHILYQKIPIKITINNWYYISQSILLSFREAKYFILYFFMYVLIGRIEIIYLEKYSTALQLGVYSSARNLLDFVQLFFIAIITSRFKEIYQNPKKMISMILVVAAIVIFSAELLSQWGYKILFPNEYEMGYKILNILIYSIIPFIIYSYLINLFNYKELTKYNVMILIIPLTIKVILYSIMKPTDKEYYVFTYLIVEYITLFISLIIFFITKLKRV